MIKSAQGERSVMISASRGPIHLTVVSLCPLAVVYLILRQADHRRVFFENDCNVTTEPVFGMTKLFAGLRASQRTTMFNQMILRPSRFAYPHQLIARSSCDLWNSIGSRGFSSYVCCRKRAHRSNRLICRNQCLRQRSGWPSSWG